MSEQLPYPVCTADKLRAAFASATLNEMSALRLVVWNAALGNMWVKDEKGEDQMLRVAPKPWACKMILEYSIGKVPDEVHLTGGADIASKLYGAKAPVDEV